MDHSAAVQQRKNEQDQEHQAKLEDLQFKHDLRSAHATEAKDQHFQKVSEQAQVFNADAEAGQERHAAELEEEKAAAIKLGESLQEEGEAAALQHAESLEAIVDKQAHLQGED